MRSRAPVGAAPGAGAGAKEVVPFTDPGNLTGNASYRRLGYVRLTGFTVYEFPSRAPETRDRHRAVVDRGPASGRLAP